MPAKNPKAVVEAFRERVRRATGCVTDQPVHAVSAQSSASAGPAGSLTFVPFERPARLSRAGGDRLLLWFRIDFVIRAVDVGRDRFDVGAVGYSYEILDAEEQEILAYHWHPVSISRVAFPHLHMTHRARSFELPSGGRIALADMHIPTGFVTLADVVRLLLTEFEVEPRRANWAEILEADWPALPAGG